MLLCVPGCSSFPQLSDDPPAAGPPIAARPRELEGSLGGGGDATFTVTDAAARVNLHLADLPGLLYRISTPADSGLAPQVTGPDRRVRLGLRRTGDDGADTVDILLNRAVRWDLRLAAGAGEQHLDLSVGRITRVDLGAGVGLVRVRLPRPSGTVPIRLTGSVGSAEFTVPRGVRVRVRLAGGAATAALPWTTRTGVPAGTVLTPRGWATDAGRYRLDARTGLGAIAVS